MQLTGVDLVVVVRWANLFITMSNIISAGREVHGSGCISPAQRRVQVVQLKVAYSFFGDGVLWPKEEEVFDALRHRFDYG